MVGAAGKLGWSRAGAGASSSMEKARGRSLVWAWGVVYCGYEMFSSGEDRVVASGRGAPGGWSWREVHVNKDEREMTMRQTKAWMSLGLLALASVCWGTEASAEDAQAEPREGAVSLNASAEKPSTIEVVMSYQMSWDMQKDKDELLQSREQQRYIRVFTKALEAKLNAAIDQLPQFRRNTFRVNPWRGVENLLDTNVRFTGTRDALEILVMLDLLELKSNEIGFSGTRSKRIAIMEDMEEGALKTQLEAFAQEVADTFLKDFAKESSKE